MRLLPPVAVLLLLIAGCGGGSGEDYQLSATEYHRAMQVGSFAERTDSQLDTIGEAFCRDVAGLDEEKRKFAVLVVRENNPELSESEAFQAASAMAGRFCPEYGADFDLDKLGDEFGKDGR
jgi:hypothetical protein